MIDPVSLSLQDNVARITIGAPAVTPAVINALERACEEARAARCAVLSGNLGTSWDLDAFADDPASLAGDTFAPLASLPCPVIAAIEGDTRSAGLALALAADIRVCGANATFSAPEVADGLIPLGATIGRLVRATDRATALAFVIAGEALSADDALRTGLVSEVTPAGSAESSAIEIAAAIASRGPIAVQYAKEAVARGADMPLEQALRYETDLTILLQATADRAEGVRAFNEKRLPQFKGE
jgi:enoyl-CoA hydratase/carnithine racemase